MLNIFALRYYYDKWINVWNLVVRKKTKIHYSYSTQTPLVRLIVNVFPHFTCYLTCSSRWRAELNSVERHAWSGYWFCHLRNSVTFYNFLSRAHPTLVCGIGRCFIAICENTCYVSTPFTRIPAVFLYLESMPVGFVEQFMGLFPVLLMFSMLPVQLWKTESVKATLFDVYILARGFSG